MMLVLLFTFLLAGVFTTYQLRDILRNKRLASYYRTDSQRDFRSKRGNNNPLDFILNQVEYTGKHSVQIIVSMIIIFMIIGVLLGFIFRNVLIGVLAAIFLGILPVFHMLKLERKKVFLITQTLSTFLAGLKTEYQLKGRLSDSFIAMEPRTSELIRADYTIFVSELDQNIDLHKALYHLAERTKCIWFSHLGDITEIAAVRTNKEGLLRTLDDLSVEIERYTREASQNLQSIQRAGIYVLAMLAILGCSIFVTTKYMEQPLNYFVQVAQGRKHLTVGVFFLMLPIITYYYRVIKGGR